MHSCSEQAASVSVCAINLEVYEQAPVLFHLNETCLSYEMPVPVRPTQNLPAPCSALPELKLNTVAFKKAIKIHRLKRNHAPGLNPYVFSYFCGVNASGFSSVRSSQAVTLMVP